MMRAERDGSATPTLPQREWIAHEWSGLIDFILTA